VSNTLNNSKQPGVEKGTWLKKKVVPLLTVLLFTAITVALFLVFARNPEKVEEFQNYGYLGAFLVSLVSNATIILPMPGFLIIFALGAVFNPVLIGLAGATGGAGGEALSYVLGWTGRGVIQNRRLYDKAVQWLKRWGVWVIFVFAATPLPFDIIGMVAGLLRFPFWKFLLALWCGKALKYVGVALAGAWGWEAVLRFLG